MWHAATQTCKISSMRYKSILKVTLAAKLSLREDLGPFF